MGGGNLKTLLYNKLQKPQVLPYNEKSKWITGYPCGKLFKRDLFENIQFPEGYWFEDTLVCMVLEHLCRTKVTTNELSFKYRMNMNSISHKFSGNHKSLDGLYVTLQLLKDSKALGIAVDTIDYYNMLLKQIVTNHRRIMSLPKNIQQAAFVVHSELICRDFCGFETTDASMKVVEALFRKHDFNGFYLWCRWH